MTNKELQERISRLEYELTEMRKKVEALPDIEKGIFKPEYEEEYWFISDMGEIYNDAWLDVGIDHNRDKIDNCFPTEQLAEDTLRMLKLIKKAKESQNGFVPDWEDWEQEKYYLYFEDNKMRIGNNFSMNIAPIFGYWKEEKICRKFIHENYEELIWFFTQYKK